MEKTIEFDRRKKVSIHLNIAPLIDVVFLLLIFFMLSSHFVAHPGIKISLPTATTTKPQLEEKIIISITGDNRLYLNGEQVVLDHLLDRVRVEIEQGSKRTVVLKADEKIDLGLAVKVMDIAKQAKAEGLVISTKITPQNQN